MKLYFYSLEDMRNGCVMNIQECEAEEKPKSYALLEDVKGYYGKSVMKSEIGTFIRKYSWEWLVVLTKRDDETVKNIFTEKIIKEIEKEKEKIRKNERRLEIIQNFTG